MKAVTLKKDDLAMARKGGFKGKKPNKPQAKTAKAIESYIRRYNIWAKKVQEAAKKGRELEKLKASISGL